MYTYVYIYISTEVPNNRRIGQKMASLDRFLLQPFRGKKNQLVHLEGLHSSSEASGRFGSLRGSAREPGKLVSCICSRIWMDGSSGLLFYLYLESAGGLI